MASTRELRGFNDDPLAFEAQRTSLAVVTVQLAHAALVDIPAAVIAVVGATLLIKFKVNATWVVAGAALAGTFVRLLG